MSDIPEQERCPECHARWWRCPEHGRYLQRIPKCEDCQPLHRPTTCHGTGQLWTSTPKPPDSEPCSYCIAFQARDWQSIELGSLKCTCEGDVRRPSSGTEGELRRALADLADWQPHTEAGLAALHPQHREAVETARALISHDPNLIFVPVCPPQEQGK